MATDTSQFLAQFDSKYHNILLRLEEYNKLFDFKKFNLKQDYIMDLKALTQQTIQAINTNLSRMEQSIVTPNIVDLTSAIRTPIRRAFQTVSGEDYPKLYREISRITHPDKISLNQNSRDATKQQFATTMSRLLERVPEAEKAAFQRAIQQHIELYKNSMPPLDGFMTSNPVDYTVNLLNAMQATLKRHKTEYLRYYLPLQYLIYALQAIVDAILYITTILIVAKLLSTIMVGIMLLLLTVSEALAGAFEIYYMFRFDGRLSSNVFLYIFVGTENINTVLNNTVTTKELANYYRTLYRYERNLTEETDETVLKYAKSKLNITCSESARIQLLNDYRINFYGWQYVRLLSLAFYEAMRTPIPSLTIGLRVQKENTRDSSMVPTSYQYDRYSGYKEKKRGNIPAWRVFNDENEENYVVLHIKNGLYRLDKDNQTLHHLKLDSPELNSLPNQYIRTKHDIFFCDGAHADLIRLELNTLEDHHVSKPHYYVGYANKLFFYNSDSGEIEHIYMDSNNAKIHTSFLEKFPLGTEIDALNTEELEFIKTYSNHDNKRLQSAALHVALKLFRAAFFLPFLLFESICQAIEIMINLLLTVILYPVFAIKLGVTFLLNSPLYLYDAWVAYQPTNEPPPEFNTPQQNAANHDWWNFFSSDTGNQSQTTNESMAVVPT